MHNRVFLRPNLQGLDSGSHYSLDYGQGSVWPEVTSL